MNFNASSRRAKRLVVLATFTLPFGCAKSASQSELDAFPVAAQGGTPSTDSTDPENEQRLTFDLAELNAVPVLDQRVLLVRVTPARQQTITFALVGDSLDASLESSLVQADAAGTATVTLTASSIPTTFTVRASIGRAASAEIPVKVVNALTGALDVAAKYSGRRVPQSYAIAAYPNKDCSSQNLGPTSLDRIYRETPTLPLRIEGVPLSTPLAVVVTGGTNLLRGCTMVRGITPPSAQLAEVPLEDLPLDFRNASLSLALSATDGLQNLKDQLSIPITPLVAALDTSGHDMVDLLAAMESVATGSLQQEFSAQRKASAWDALVMTSYADGADRLRRQLLSWLKQGVERLSTQPTLRVRLDLGPNDASTSKLALTSVAGISNTSGLLMQVSDLALNPEANDWLNWSSELSISSANLLEQLALGAANAEVPGFDSLPAHLENRLDCGAFAAMLNSNVVWPNSSTRACAAPCLATLCTAGLAQMYQRATSAVYAFRTAILLNASGQIVVDTTAKPVAMSGTWIGATNSGTNTSTVAGRLETQ